MPLPSDPGFLGENYGKSAKLSYKIRVANEPILVHGAWVEICGGKKWARFSPPFFYASEFFGRVDRVSGVVRESDTSMPCMGCPGSYWATQSAAYLPTYYCSTG